MDIIYICIIYNSLTTNKLPSSSGSSSQLRRGYHRIPGVHGWPSVKLPSGYVNSLLLKMAIEIVDFPIKNGGFFHSYVSLPEGTKFMHLPFVSYYYHTLPLGQNLTKNHSRHFLGRACGRPGRPSILPLISGETGHGP